jgi:hypothetical protein
MVIYWTATTAACGSDQALVILLTELPREPFERDLPIERLCDTQLIGIYRLLHDPTATAPPLN